MTRRAVWMCVVAGLLALLSIPLGIVYWHFGGGSILIATNVGREGLTGVSVVLLSETYSDEEPKREWALGLLRPGESTEVELSGSSDANPAIRFMSLDGTSTTSRIRVYVGGHPIEVRADLSKDKIERVLFKRRHASEYRKSDWIRSPR